MRRSERFVEIIGIGGNRGSRRRLKRGIGGDKVNRAWGGAWVRFLDKNVGRWSMIHRGRFGHGVHGAVRGHEMTHNGFKKLGANIARREDRVAGFSTGDTLNKVGVLHIVDEDIDFLRVIEGRGSVLDERSKLKVVTEELSVVKEVEVALAGIIGDKNGGLIMKDRMREEQNVFKGAKTITVASRDKAREAAAFGKHVGFGEQTKEREGHARQFNFHEIGEIVGGKRTSGEATFTAMIGAEAPEWMYIETVVHAHAALDKLGVPGADAGVGIVVT